MGGLEPDAIVQQGIKVVQQKLAAVIQELTGSAAGGGGHDGRAGMNGDVMDEDGLNGYGGGGGGPRSPVDLNGFGGVGHGAGGPGGAGRDYDMDQGYTTPYLNGSGGAGGATPYGATPYGGGRYA